MAEFTRHYYDPNLIMKKSLILILAGIVLFSAASWGDEEGAEKRVYFSNREEAVKAGFRPCRICKPDEDEER